MKSSFFKSHYSVYGICRIVADSHSFSGEPHQDFRNTWLKPSELEGNRDACIEFSQVKNRVYPCAVGEINVAE